MTNPPPDEMRASFEKWAGAKGYALHIRDMKGSTRIGEYGYADTQRLWETWQAALSHQGEVVKVSEIEQLRDVWKDDAPTYYVDALTALISKAEKAP